MNLTDYSLRLDQGAALRAPAHTTRLSAGAAHLMRMLDEIDYGLLLVTAEGQLRYANQLALQEVAGAGLLQLHDGALCTRHSGESGALRAALADAVRGRRALLTLGSNGHALSAAVIPLPGSEGEAEESLALLVFNKRQSCVALTLGFYARAVGLTGAESSVLLRLCQGAKPKEIARQLTVAISTVRSQITSIRNKTQTESIRELVQRVAALPPITPVLKDTPSAWALPCPRGPVPSRRLPEAALAC